LLTKRGLNMSELRLRPYQLEALEKLRQGFAAGKRKQVLVSPTGSGKTEMAIALLNATKQKGNKAAMILDRIILCDQTSKRLDRYNIDHGVLQAKHWRWRPYENIQVCSAQTLEKRGSFPGLNLLIVDEAHTTRQQTMDFIKNNPDVRVIGLTATPFTKGLGSVYENVVSTVTTKQLVDQGVLVPLKVFVAKEIDMTGAKKVAGEWSQGEAEKRGMVITGDIVAEWIKKTHEIFGKPEKTVVFCAGVAHGADLARKFAEQGYNFVAVSYLDDDKFKQEVITEFSKPDTEIHGLIATDILTKGFDVPDVRIGVSARPFSKSLSSHIQQMGRVMRGSPGKDFALWLDHSGNYVRFRDEWEEVFEIGVNELDDGKEKAKKEPTEKEKEASKCPVCSALWPKGSDTCANCGHVRERKNKVSSVAGELTELGAMTREQKQDFWSQLRYKVMHDGWRDGRAAHTFKDKFGVWPRGLDDKTVKQPTAETERFIKQRLRHFLYKQRKI
jgi:DNA repair protein RadD